MQLQHLVAVFFYQVVYGASEAYWVGFKAGHHDGLNAVYDIGDTCWYTIMGNQRVYYTQAQTDQYNKGYDDGWNTTCKQGIAEDRISAIL